MAQHAFTQWPCDCCLAIGSHMRSPRLLIARAPADELAVTYNDRSPLENMHMSTAWRLLMRPGNNFLEGLDKPRLVAFRKLMIDLVLATDMWVAEGAHGGRTGGVYRGAGRLVGIVGWTNQCGWPAIQV